MNSGMGKALLALDCSLKWTNVAVLSLSDGGLLAAERLNIGRRQSAELPLVVESILAKTKRGFGDLGLVAVTNGPGYFTGIRVGASYAMALAYGLNLKLVPVYTLHMLDFSWLSKAVLAAGTPLRRVLWESLARTPAGGVLRWEIGGLAGRSRVRKLPSRF